MNSRNDICEIKCIHEDAVAEVKNIMIDEHLAGQLADFFKAMADPGRVKILYALKNRELCVCDLAAITNATDSAVSHQLRLLRTMKLVKNRRDGKIMYYSLADGHVESLFSQGLEHLNE